MDLPAIEDNWNDKRTSKKKSGYEPRQTDNYLFLSYRYIFIISSILISSGFNSSSRPFSCKRFLYFFPIFSLRFSPYYLSPDKNFALMSKYPISAGYTPVGDTKFRRWSTTRWYHSYFFSFIRSVYHETLICFLLFIIIILIERFSSLPQISPAWRDLRSATTSLERSEIPLCGERCRFLMVVCAERHLTQ